MILICVSRYRSSLGSYEPGQEIHLTDEEGALLRRTSPGSFREIGLEPELPEEPDLSAVSAETETGLVVPDRRQRGGRKRIVR